MTIADLWRLKRAAAIRRPNPLVLFGPSWKAAVMGHAIRQ